jgi:hypothetical protein
MRIWIVHKIEGSRRVMIREDATRLPQFFELFEVPGCLLLAFSGLPACPLFRRF